MLRALTPTQISGSSNVRLHSRLLLGNTEFKIPVAKKEPGRGRPGG